MTTRFAGDPTTGAWRTALHGAPLVGIDLAPLNAEEARLLATRASSMPPAVVASCVERAEGNPLFLLQLLLSAGEAAQSSLPGSIQALVHARMDRLAAEDKVGAAGRRRSRPALRRRRAASPAARAPATTSGAWWSTSSFAPTAASSCSATPSSATAPTSRSCTSGAACSTAGRPSGSSRATSSLAAEHFDRGEDARAAAAYLAAGNSVAAQFRHAAALGLIERGLVLAATHEIRFALLMARGRLMLELGRSAEAIEACRAALEASASPGERAQALIASRCGDAPQRPDRRGPRRARRGRAAGRRRSARARPLAPASPARQPAVSARPPCRLPARARARAPARPRSRLAGGRGGGARRARRRLLPPRSHAVGAPAVPRVRGARARSTASAGSRWRTCRWWGGPGCTSPRSAQPSPSATRRSPWRSGRRSHAPS